MSTEVMSGRERLLAAIRGEDVDRLPWAPLLDGYFLEGRMGQVEAFRRLGADAFVRSAISFLGTEPMPTSVAPRGKSLPYTLEMRSIGADTEVSYETPVGTLTEHLRLNEESPNIPWVTKHKVETLEDVKILQWLYEHAEYESVPSLFEPADQEVGDAGIATISTVASPMFWMLNWEASLVNFWELFFEHPTEVEALLEAAHQMNIRKFNAIAEGPGEVVIQYENLSSSLCSPALWEKHTFPQVNAYADILHDAGKIFLQHCCGHLAAFGAKISEMHIDGITDIATPPTGTISLAGAREMWGPDKLVMGGIDATHFVGDTPEELKIYVRGLIEEMGDGRRTILGSGDATPKGTPWENLEAVTEVIQEIGAFPLQHP